MAKGNKLTKAQRLLRGKRMCKAERRYGKGACGNYAVRGKEYCRLHGGLIPVKHGLYSKYMSPAQKKRYEEFRKRALENGTVFDLTDEIVWLKSMCAELLEQVKKEDSGVRTVDALPVITELRRTMADATRIEESMRSLEENAEDKQNNIESILDLLKLGDSLAKRPKVKDKEDRGK